jgi:hypothetical protein
MLTANLGGLSYLAVVGLLYALRRLQAEDDWEDSREFSPKTALGAKPNVKW